MTEVDQVRDKGGWHFGLIVRDERQLAKVRDKVTQKYGLQLISGFRCAFRDPFDNRIDVVDLHDESLVWLFCHTRKFKAPAFDLASKKTRQASAQIGDKPPGPIQ